MIGTLKVLAGLGLLTQTVTGIAPILSPVAGVGLAVLRVSAAPPTTSGNTRWSRAPS
jgi:hypothetical protein